MNRVVGGFLIAILLGTFPSNPAAQTQPWVVKLGPALQQRLSAPLGRSRVVIVAANSAAVPSLTSIVQFTGGSVLRTLPIVNAIEADLPNVALVAVASNPLTAHISVD